MKQFLKKGIQRLTDVLTNLFTDRRFYVMVCVLGFGIMNAMAASDPFAAATGEITGYQDSVQKLLYAIAAIIALVGAFNVFHKMTNGDQDVKKTIMLTLGGCIAMIALSNALPAFFS